MFRTIMVPLDGSAFAEQALPFARTIAREVDAQLHLVRIAPPRQRGMDAGEPLSPLNRGAAVKYLEGVAERMRRTHMNVTTHVSAAAAPELAIVDFVDTHGGDVIVLPSSGAGGVRRMLLGSVADKVVRSARVPELVCNARRGEVLPPAHTSETSDGVHQD
jgi:nucleotide-binding universal stress UspA family protein